MSPNTRLAEKNNKEDALEKKKNESMGEEEEIWGGEEESCGGEEESCEGEEEEGLSEKEKRNISEKKERGREKKRDAAKKKTETETAEKKRKQNSGVDGGSLSNPTKRARNTASPPEQEHQGDHSPAPSAELPSQADVEGTPGPAHPSEPQKSPTQAPSEAENPLQPPVTSLSISEYATNCPSHRVDNHDEEIVSNNRDSHTPEAAIDHTAQRTEAEDMAIEQLEGDQLEEEEHEAGNEPPRIVGGEAVADLESLKETVMSLMSQMTTMEGNVNNKLEGFDRKLKMLEGDSIGREGFENMDFQYNEDGGTSGQQEKGNEDEEDEDDGKEAEHDDDNGEKDDTEKEHEDEEAEDDGNEHEDEDNDEKDDTEKDHDEEAEDDGNEHENDGKEPEKELEVQPEKEATDDAEDDGKEPQKELEVQPEKEAIDDAEEYTLRVMEAAAEKVEAEAARKEAMTRPKRVLKPSHLQKSPFVKK
ncbi:unnamed protein product [Brassica napus]|uniref:(rape) hypothetical protein n=1 Tax=Brassica napus TaxID=3708 RepID=A0A816INT3_BRANA|nr:unnamed protein product [Brassica napus]